MLNTRLILSLLAASLLVACGGPKGDPKNPGDVPPPPPDGKQVAAQPQRKVSKEAKVDFKDAIKAYEAAKKSGGITKANCSSLAAEFADVYASHPKIPEAKFNEGRIYEACGRVRDAERIYQAVVQRHPNFGPALNNLGQIYFSRGQLSTAIQYFQKAAAVKNSDAYSNLAVIQRNAAKDGDVSQVKEAVNNVHRALAVDSYNIEAYGTLALVLYDHAKTKSQLEMARLICVQATKVQPDYAPIYNTLGLILLKQGKVTPALAKFRKAAALDNNLMVAWMNIGAITLSFRDYKSAEEAFRKVLSLAPDKAVQYEATVGLGVALRGQRKFRQAMAQYKAAKAIDPSNVDIAYNMGILVQDYMFDASDPASAIADLQRASNLLNRYLSGGDNPTKKKDCRRRLKNINDLIPMLKEQQKMMREMQQQGAGGGAKKSG